MRFRQTTIAGVWIVDAEPHVDERGLLRRHFCAEEFGAHGLCTTVVQGNISENLHRHTLRGFHYQEPPHGEAKTVSVICGALYVVVADIRPESVTYLQWIAEDLTAENRRSLYLSPGCAMAILTLKDHTVLHYYMSEKFASQSYKGIRYNDPTFRFSWPIEPRVISEKDRSFPDFKPVRR